MNSRIHSPIRVVFCVLLAGDSWLGAQTNDLHAWREPKAQVGNVFPHITVHAPGAGSTSETGIGALLPWADRLWAVGYVAHLRGPGIGLHELTGDFRWRLHLKSVTGTFANRLVHWPSQQAIIGPHLIEAAGNVRTLEELARHRPTDWALCKLSLYVKDLEK